MTIKTEMGVILTVTTEDIPGILLDLDRAGYLIREQPCDVERNVDAKADF